jgi:predicted DNA-binding WGR domain protein
MVPEEHHLTITAPGLQAMAPQADDRGGLVQVFQLASVPRNGVLSITVSGLPTRGSLGKTITTALVAALLLAVVLGWRRPRTEGQLKAKDFGRRRDQLFAELVEVERARRSTGADDAPLAQRRAKLVAALEALDSGRAGEADAASPTGKSA